MLEGRAKELHDRLDEAIQTVMSEYQRDDGLERFIPTHWVLLVGCQEATGDESLVSYIPRDGQPFYVSVGLVEYQSARLRGQAASQDPR